MEFIRKMSLNGYQYLSGPRKSGGLCESSVWEEGECISRELEQVREDVHMGKQCRAGQGAQPWTW